jgi:GAF domain-containing protein
MPLERAGTVHGLLYLGLRRGVFPLGSEGEEVVAAFAAQAALALESARYLDDLRRQAEEYRILHTNTQRIIESSAAAILVCDASAHILTANRHAAGIFERQAQSGSGSRSAIWWTCPMPGGGSCRCTPSTPRLGPSPTRRGT